MGSGEESAGVVGGYCLGEAGGGFAAQSGQAFSDPGGVGGVFGIFGIAFHQQLVGGGGLGQGGDFSGIWVKQGAAEREPDGLFGEEGEGEVGAGIGVKDDAGGVWGLADDGKDSVPGAETVQGNGAVGLARGVPLGEENRILRGGWGSLQGAVESDFADAGVWDLLEGGGEAFCQGLGVWDFCGGPGVDAEAGGIDFGVGACGCCDEGPIGLTD